MKKRIFSLVIALILCFAMTVPVTILADNFDDSKVYWKKTVTVEGRKVKLVIESANGAGKLSGGNVTMTYDSDALTFNPEGSSDKIGANFGTLGFVNPNKAGRYIVNFAGLYPIENDGVLAVAMFDIAEGKVCNADTFKLEKEEFSSSDPSNVKIDSSTGPIVFTCLHKDTVESVKTPATCEDAGVKTITCSDCGNVSEETIGKLGHDWDEGKVTTEPTTESKGVKTFTCKRCKTTKTEEIDALKPFDPTKVYWKKSVTVEGRKVKLVIESVNGAGKLAGGNVTMTYDSDALTFNSEGSSTKIGTAFGGMGFINPNKAGRYIVNFAGLYPIENDGVIAVAMFDIAEGKVCNADTFKLEKEEFSSNDPSNVKIDWTTGPIEFTCLHKDSAESITTPATCENDGVKTTTCSDCGNTSETTIDKLGHDWDEGTVTTQPTCEEKGAKTFTCSRCQETKTEEVPAAGHVPDKGTVVTEPTCTEPGVLVTKCEVCAKELSRVDIPALDHDWDEGVVTREPTTAEKGEKKFTCKRCDATKTEEIDYVKPFDPTKVYWKKTVTVDGTKVKLVIESVNGAGRLAGGNVTMTYDSDALTFNSEGSSTKIGTAFGGMGFINPNKAGRYIVNFAGLYPIENDGVIAVAMFDIAEGKLCTADTFKLEKEEFSSEDPTNKDIDWTTGPIEFTCKHTNTHDEVVVPATCKADGSEATICDSCGETISTTTIPKGEHNFTEKVEEKPATCTEGGQIVWKCSACDETKTENTKPLGHNEGEGVVTTEPTCENEGVRTFYCTRCQEQLRTEKIDALGHDWDEGTVTTEPTCTEEGVKTFTCKRCQKTRTESIDALGHNEGEGEVTTEPTCTEEGVRTFKCTRCGTVLRTEKIDALGHEWDEGTVTTEPTCTEEGVKTFTCKRCQETRTESVDALGHDLSDAKVTKEPTCTEKGEKVGTCSRCHEEGVREEIPALGHDWDEGKVTKEATAATEGERTYTCKRCDETKVETIAKLPPVIIEGNNSVANKEQTKDMTFRSDAAFVDFIRVELDGKVLDAKNYTIKEGSIIVTLNKDFVSTLSVGEHTLGIVSASGTALAKFTIEANENSAAVSPKTGDSSQVVLYSFAAIISLAAIAVIVYKKKISE